IALPIDDAGSVRGAPPAPGDAAKRRQMLVEVLLWTLAVVRRARLRPRDRAVAPSCATRARITGSPLIFVVAAPPRASLPRGCTVSLRHAPRRRARARARAQAVACALAQSGALRKVGGAAACLVQSALDGGASSCPAAAAGAPSAREGGARRSARFS